MKITKQQLKEIIKEELSSLEEVTGPGSPSVSPELAGAKTRAPQTAQQGTPATAQQRGGDLHHNVTGMSNTPTENAQLTIVAKELKPLVAQLQNLLQQIVGVL